LDRVAIAAVRNVRRESTGRLPLDDQTVEDCVRSPASLQHSLETLVKCDPVLPNEILERLLRDAPEVGLVTRKPLGSTY
jgi:hypothetical protein